MTLATKAFIWAFMLTGPLPIVVGSVPEPQNSPHREVIELPQQLPRKPDYTALEQCIVQKESGGNPQAIGKAGEYGLWQILPSTWTYYKCSGDPFNPITNEKCARKIIKDDGYTQWSTYAFCKEKSPLKADSKEG